MCGISGIINQKNSPVKEDEIVSMNNLIIHRGPDSEGYYFFKNFAFGHRRLSIIDLSKKGSQPMSYQENYTITYNGEIYNYIELRQELKNLGYTFHSESDTEVILASYIHWGTDCVKKFNGMWAFALFDKFKNHIFCSRDRFGVKPFYYTEINSRFIFGSEIKQLLPFQSSIKANLPILMDYLIPDYEDHTNETFFENIYKLEQSHNLIYDLEGNTYKIMPYYEIKIDNSLADLEEKESIMVFTNLLTDSIQLRLRSDVKVGTCLSGGVDSSAVAIIASTIYNQNSVQKFSAFTAKSIEKATDESQFAKKVVEKADLDWHITEPTYEDFISEIDTVIRIQEEPFGSPSIFMQYKVFSKALENNCIVMLDGQGGDETLLGYERYYPSYLLSLPKHKVLNNFIFSSKNSRLSKSQLLFYWIYFTSPSIRASFLRYRFRFIKRKMFDLISKKALIESSLSYSDIINLQKVEIKSLQLPHLLKYEDRNSMAHSIESRLPFLDYRMVEVSLSLNNNFKIRDGWTKYILRKAIDPIVPKEVAWRKSKLGFNAPESVWLSLYKDDMFKTVENSSIIHQISDFEKLGRDYSTMNYRIMWRLYNLAKWEESFNVCYE
jgi:asparagine synthase (glutamine-hydrolysing)